MKQLKLKIESLDVQTFPTERAPEETRGTVQAHANTGEYDCTWNPGLQCYTNAIAYPTEPRCDRNCRLTAVPCF
jgi:hypothetical protein